MGPTPARPHGAVPAAAPRGVELREELLPGWYDNWVVLQRERLRQLRMYASEALADELARVGRNGEAVIRWSRTTAVTGT